MTHKMIEKEVLAAISEIAQSFKNTGLMLNERYLHHLFSHLIQEKHHSLDLTDNRKEILLHPEWPTYKKQTNILFGKYRGDNGKYRPNRDGTAGFIDFAIGNYSHPEIGIEFTLKFGWSNEEIIYDFLKLLDTRNPFRTSISLNFILRHSRLVKGKSLENLEKHMNDAFKEAVSRLDGTIDNSRKLYFIIVELDRVNNRKIWIYNKNIGTFEIGLPVIYE